MSKRNIILTLVFVVIVILELAGNLLDNITLEYFTRPLIMVWIATYFLLNSKKKSFRTGVLIAFFFSWAGDMLMMLSDVNDNELFVYAGFGGFFIAQIAYIFVFFLKTENDIKGFLLRNPLWIIPLVGYGVLIYMTLYPRLEGMMVWIILIYAISLIGMSLAALNRRDRVGHRSFQLVFTGAVFFVISDSMIAVNEFHTEFPQAGFLIMFSYIAAQYLIMNGLILEKEKPSER